MGVRRELTLFAGVAALTLAVVGAGAVVASRSVARTQALKESERITDRLAKQLVAPLLEDALRGDTARREELDRAIEIRMNDGYLTEVTVWDRSGRVLYSDRPEEIGQIEEAPEEVAAAIDGDARSSDFEEQPEATDEVFSDDDPGFVEVYVPLDIEGQPPLAFEAYFDYSRVNENATTLLAAILPLVLIPLLVLQIIQAPIAISLAGRVRRHEAERSALLKRTLSESEKERMRVAADLHDGPIQDLAGVGYALGAIAPAIPDAYQDLMRSVHDTVTHAIGSLRRLMVDLYPPDLDAAQLALTIDNLAVPLREKGIDVEVVADPLPDLDNDSVTTLYRVARETLANVAEHAAASTVRVALMATTFRDDTGSPSVSLRVSDDGVGIDERDVDKRADGHLGLRLLKDRVESLGGTFTLTTARSRGTTIVATLPVAGGPSAR
ncbi:sensor histidine kinase [Nakamurella sp. GG22]